MHDRLFARRDRLRAELAATEREIAAAANAHAVANRLWGYTPLMFERAFRKAQAA